MNKCFILFICLIIFSCTDISKEATNLIEITFIPKTEYTLTPMKSLSARSSDIEIIGLIYQNDQLIDIVKAQNGVYKTILQLGGIYHAQFLGNATPFLKDIDKLSTAMISMDTIHSGQFGDEIYIAPIIQFTANSSVQLAATLECKIGIISFTSLDDPIPTEISNVYTHATEIGFGYIFHNGYTHHKNITVRSDQISNYNFIIYSFIFNDQNCELTSDIQYKESASRIWEMGTYSPRINHQYRLSGKLKDQI